MHSSGLSLKKILWVEQKLFIMNEVPYSDWLGQISMSSGDNKDMFQWMNSGPAHSHTVVVQDDIYSDHSLYKETPHHTCHMSDNGLSPRFSSTPPANFSAEFLSLSNTGLCRM